MSHVRYGTVDFSAYIRSDNLAIVIPYPTDNPSLLAIFAPFSTNVGTDFVPASWCSVSNRYISLGMDMHQSPSRHYNIYALVCISFKPQFDNIARTLDFIFHRADYQSRLQQLFFSLNSNLSPLLNKKEERKFKTFIEKDDDNFDMQ